MLRATGLDDAAIAKPLVAVVSTWTDVSPCNITLRELAQDVREGIQAGGGTAVEFNTIAVTDGIAMGSEGMRNSLASREVIADSIEIAVNGHSRLMPVLELINHAPDGAPYVVDQGISLRGRFTDEVWACYRRQMDGFHFFFNYHFASPCRVVLSCAVTIELPGLGVLRIGRDDGQVEHRQGASWPRVTTHPGEIQLSFVALANQDAPTQPREVFVRLMAEHGLPTARGHELFDGLIAHHRQVLLAFIQACEVGARADVGLYRPFPDASPRERIALI